MPGNIFEELDNRYAPPQQPAPVVIPALPGAPMKQRGQALDQQNTESTIAARAEADRIAREHLALEQAEEKRKAAAAPVALVKDTALASEANAKAVKAAQDQREQAFAQADANDNVQLTLDKALQLLSDPEDAAWSTGAASNLAELPWASKARTLKSLIGSEQSPVSANNMISTLNSLGASLAPVSNQDADQLKNSITSLDRALTPEEVTENVKELKRHYLRIKVRRLGLNPEDPAVQQRFNFPVLGGTEVFQEAPRALISGGNKTVDPPREMQLEYARALTAIPKGQLTVEKYTQLRDALDKKYGFAGSGAMEPKGLEDFVRTYNDPKGRVNLVIPGAEAAPTQLEKNISEYGGTGKGALTINALNAATGGIPELLAGEEGRRGLAAVTEASPNASMAGEVLGSVAGVKGLGVAGKLAAGGRLLPSAVGREVLTDAGYSAARGFNSSEKGEGVASGLGEGAVAIATNLATRGALRGGRELASPAQRQLIEANTDMRLSPFQRAGMPEIEAPLRNFPGVHQAKAEAVQDWSRQFKSRALADLGEELPAHIPEGRESIAYIHRQIDGAYKEFENRVSGNLTSKGRSTIKAMLDPANFPSQIETQARDKLIKTIGTLGAPGAVAFTGKELLKTTKELTRLARDWTKQGHSVNTNPGSALRSPQEYYNAARTAAELRDLIIDRLPSKADRLRLENISQASGRMMLVDSAASKLGAKEGIVTPEGLAAASTKFDPSMNKSRTAAGEAKYQPEIEEAQKLLGASPAPEVNAMGALTAAGLGAASLGGAFIGSGGGKAGSEYGTEEKEGGINYTALAPAVAAALLYGKGSKRVGGPLFAGKRPLGLEKLNIPMLSQAVQAYMVRKKETE